MTRRLKELPKFATEAEERAFWQSHTTTDYIDWAQARIASFPNLHPPPKTVPETAPS